MFQVQLLWQPEAGTGMSPDLLAPPSATTVNGLVAAAVVALQRQVWTAALDDVCNMLEELYSSIEILTVILREFSKWEW